MAINGAADHGEHGCALLLTSAPPGRHRVLDTASALPLLAAVPPHVLTGSQSGGSVVQLVDPVDANTVTTHLRTAAAVPGPLLVYVCGQVTIDRKQRLPHLVLGRTTADTVRYTALPWHWLAVAFQQRPPGTTAVVCDLVADETAWRQISGRPEQLTAGLTLYGVLAPPPPKREIVACSYSRALADLLRAATARPPMARLHQEAVAAAGATGGRQLLFGAPDFASAPRVAEREPQGWAAHPVPQQPYGAGQSVGAEHTGAGAVVPQRTPSAAQLVVPGGVPSQPETPRGGGAPQSGTWPAALAAPQPRASIAAPLQATDSEPPTPQPVDGEPAVPENADAPPISPEPDEPAPPAAASAHLDVPSAPAAQRADSRPTTLDTPPPAVPAPVPLSSFDAPPPVPSPPDPSPSADAAPPAAPRFVPPQSGMPASPPPLPPAAPARWQPRPPAVADPHDAIRDAARAGRHTEAAAIAAAWEQAALRAAGPSSAEAVHWVEVRADLAMLAQDTGRACELWLTAASARLTGGQDTESEDVIKAVDRAHHCWSRITDPARARQLAPDLVRLRRRVVGRQPDALSALQQRLATLGAVPTDGHAPN
ncbi:hypothetical protein [Streptantibioticus ferralitis]|uniref:Uncharacterized protein n=1 Tax=Streptantibioticus ferralitis TaxID=236510 RepID=A0ABT5YVX7_9ACTN|nr:hypothetical protein [Streptantibioticus ferralitis]MDF2255757.1 hypothetical protein [Streptantibioticus ferralitis]